MTLRPDPLKALLDLQERMNRLFEEALGRERLEEPALLSGSWVPAADMYESAEAYWVEVELAGLGRDDVEILFQGDELVIRGERRPGGTRPEVFHRLERRHGPFTRSFHFAEEVDPESVRAEFADGLLRLEIPKRGARARLRRAERADT